MSSYSVKKMTRRSFHRGGEAAPGSDRPDAGALCEEEEGLDRAAPGRPDASPGHRWSPIQATILRMHGSGA